MLCTQPHACHCLTFHSITDGILPLRIPGWTRGAECFKTYNRQGNCLRAAHCIERDGPYCMNFKRGNEVGNGRDLATVLFYRTVTADDPGCLTIDLPRSSTTWATVTAITDVNQNDPIGRVSGTSCDKGKLVSLTCEVQPRKCCALNLMLAIDSLHRLGF